MIPEGCVAECRGCSHREMTMSESLLQKFEFVRGKLSDWADLVEPVHSVTDKNCWGYRDKTTLSARFDGVEWQLGMWRRDEFIPIPYCPIHSPRLNGLLNAIRQAIPKSQSFALAYIVVSGAQVVLVIKSKQKPNVNWLNCQLVKELESFGVEGLWYHLNPSTGRRIFEKSGWHLIWGKPRSVDYNGLIYGPAAFQQLIPELYNQSLDLAEQFLQPSNHVAVVDLYCGTGNSMLRWVRQGASVIGVELGGEAVECARINVPDATVLRGACRHRVPQVRDWVNEKRMEGKSVVLYVNPPRTGLEVEVLDWIIAEGKPDRIAYLSCSPGTLSKNISYLAQNGYDVVRCIPFDFFPQTHHVETLVLLQKC
ncbi:class I SAM-dependent RNA methyltransferase [Tenuifilum thalassicum]|uniref:Class I SAM-dependent RNA methyltransferase n=2 Tax=Tenuifilum thalassicum TaxID=2590900 RepID=A0A7D4BEC7_9BACT|nr:class I SAM-dependent RNA methyltransferase [Tenuifilum thalassicum]